MNFQAVGMVSSIGQHRCRPLLLPLRLLSFELSHHLPTSGDYLLRFFLKPPKVASTAVLGLLSISALPADHSRGH